MIPQVLYKSDKQIISRFECPGNMCELEARTSCSTSAIFSSPGISVKDLEANRVTNPYSSVRLTAGKINTLIKEPGQISTVYCIETNDTVKGEYARKLKDCKQLNPADGEYIYETEGVENGANKAYSIAIVIILSGKSSKRHYHPEVEEIYIVTAGVGRLEIEGLEDQIVKPGHVAPIPIGKKHQIFSIGDESLEMVVTCRDAWTLTCGIYD